MPERYYKITNINIKGWNALKQKIKRIHERGEETNIIDWQRVKDGNVVVSAYHKPWGELSGVLRQRSMVIPLGDMVSGGHADQYDDEYY